MYCVCVCVARRSSCRQQWCTWVWRTISHTPLSLTPPSSRQLLLFKPKSFTKKTGSLPHPFLSVYQTDTLYSLSTDLIQRSTRLCSHIQRGEAPHIILPRLSPPLYLAPQVRPGLVVAVMVPRLASCPSGSTVCELFTALLKKCMYCTCRLTVNYKTALFISASIYCRSQVDHMTNHMTVMT